jgi:hypothetical protein
MTEVKQEVQQFYDQIGWQRVGLPGQNRPVCLGQTSKPLEPIETCSCLSKRVIK